MAADNGAVEALHTAGADPLRNPISNPWAAANVIAPAAGAAG